MRETDLRLVKDCHRMKSFWFSLVIFLLCSISSNAQTISVTGIVSDVSGDALPGVSVVIKGTTEGVVTDINGKYTLNAGKNAMLVFSFIGMKTQEVNVSGRRTINVKMVEDTEILDEVVVVGYGVQKKSSLTSAVSAIKGDDLLKAPSTNISQILGGRLPGISSVQESGEPGLDQASLKIRGSIYSVMYVVDGFPVKNINDIDPNDIESVSVLKDGASAAVYGLQAAGGIIIITTKKGEAGKTKVTYDASFGASMNANFPKFMNGPQFAYYYNMGDMMDQLANGTIKDKNQYVPVYSKENVAAMTNSDPTDGWDNVNYIDKVFGTGFNQKHSVTIQGGNEKMHYFASVGYLGQEGNIENFNYRRYNLRTNIESDFAKNLHFSLGVSGNVARRNTPGYASGGTDSNSSLGEQGWLSVAHQAIIMHPYLPEKYNGLYTATLQNNTSLPNSPLAAIYESGYKKTRSNDLQTNISLSYNVPWIKGLSVKANGSYSYGTSHNKNLNTPYSTMVRNSSMDWVQASDPRGVDLGINLGEGQYTYEQLVGQASINYVNTFGKNNIDIMALVEARDYKENSMSAYAKNLPFAELPELGRGVATDSPIGGWSDASRSAGYVFRLKYDYDNKYLAEVSGRYDGSYKFYGMSGKRWGFFPSASLGWRMSKEDFMSGLSSFLNDLKVRTSVGLLGNSTVPAYSFLSQYTNNYSSNVVINGTLSPAYYTNVIANPYLTWEKTLSWNTGFDFTMWNGLLGMEFDVFYNYTYDILTAMGSNYPPSMGGYYPSWKNNNKIDAKGLDVLVTHRNKLQLAGKVFNYGVSASLTYSKTRWLVYPDSPNTMEWRKVTGTTYGALMGWEAEGLFKSEDEITNSAWYGTRPNIGDIKYKDLNGDGKITEDDKAIIGRSNRPQLTYGLNLNCSWNGFDFNAQFTGGALFDVSLTGTYYNGYDDNTVWTQTFKEGANSPLYLVENAYSTENPNGTFPRITAGHLTHGGDNGLSSTFWMRDGKYIRLKSAQLGYTFPQKWMRVMNLQNLRLYVEGSNLFTISGLPAGIDPESPGVNNGYYPQQRIIMGGISVTF